MKVLISAYACGPGRGSEPGAGWAWACAAARDNEVWLLTHATNAGAIEAALATDLRLAFSLHPIYVVNPGWAQWIRRRGPLRFVYYILWQQISCRRVARHLHDRIGFDVCHHVTYAADWLPAGISVLSDVPFVWGPVGGSSTLGDRRLWLRLGLRGMLSEAVRAAVLGLARRVVGQRLAHRATVMLGQNPDVAARFAPVPVTVEPHIALSSMAHIDPGAIRDDRRAIYVGRLLHWKGLRLALRALRRKEAAGWRLDLYGDGSHRRQLERLTRRWGLTDRVHFHGQRPRSEITVALARASALLFPSLHDAAGWAVAEAIDACCPVICLDLGGPPSLLDSHDGLKVAVRGDVVGGLAKALQQLHHCRPTPGRWSADRLPDRLGDVYSRAVRPSVYAS